MSRRKDQTTVNMEERINLQVLGQDLVNPDPDPNVNLPVPPVIDFDSVARISAWIRLQKKPAKLLTALIVYFLDTGLFSLEMFFLISLLTVSDGVKDEEILVSERRVTFIVFLVTSVINLIVKLFLDGSIKHWGPFSFPETLKFFGKCQMHTSRPIRYMRVFHLWIRKNRIVGKRFVHGEVVTRDQIIKVMGINRDDLIAARDELYESFILGIPMALTQCYLFSSSSFPLKVCSARDGFRLFLIILQLIGAVKSTMMFEWKKRLYCNSIHVLGYLFSNGRFPVPDYQEDAITIVLKTICHTTSILARFFLVVYMSGIHWSVGLACTTSLLLWNMMLKFASPSAISATVENLPEGVSIPAVYFPDQWVNIFTAKDTRYYDLTREPVITRSSKEIRIPMVFVQAVPFACTFWLLYIFVHILGPETTQWTGMVENIGNTTYCKHHDPTKNIFDFYDFISVNLHTFGQVFHIGFQMKNDYAGFATFHVVLIYIQIMTVLLYNYYVNKYFENLDTCYPIMLTCAFYRKMFQIIGQVANGDNSLKLYMLKRLIFLISVDLQTFNKIYFEYRKLRLVTDDFVRWWDAQILAELGLKDPERVSHRQYETGRRDPTIQGTPISHELDEALHFIQTDVVGLQLVFYCARRFDVVFSCEMTSKRLAKTFDLFGMDKTNLVTAVLHDLACLRNMEL